MNYNERLIFYNSNKYYNGNDVRIIIPNTKQWMPILLIAKHFVSCTFLKIPWKSQLVPLINCTLTGKT